MLVPLSCTVALAGMVGAFHLLDDIAPPSHILNEGGVHGTVYIADEVRVTDSMDLLGKLESLKDNICFHLR